jgi:hypothetical protein
MEPLMDLGATNNQTATKLKQPNNWAISLGKRRPLVLEFNRSNGRCAHALRGIDTYIQDGLVHSAKKPAPWASFWLESGNADRHRDHGCQEFIRFGLMAPIRPVLD